MNELEILEKLLLSFILSSLIGIERETHYKPAGFRTHVLIGLASTIFTIISLHAVTINPEKYDFGRILSSILIGMGFIGAGTIIKLEKSSVIGITTAASLWFTTSIGIAVGLGYYKFAIISAIFGFIVLRLKFVEKLFK